jgi:hypothetical protein
MRGLRKSGHFEASTNSEGKAWNRRNTSGTGISSSIVSLGPWAATTSTDTSVSSLFLGGGLLMNPHHAGIDHLDLAVMGLDDGIPCA